MIANNSMFYNCSCSGSGGAIHVVCSNSYLRMICAHRCSCSSLGHFAEIKATQANQVEYLSVSFCSHSTSGYHPIYIESGNQRVDKTNSSMNNADMASGIRIWFPYTITSSHCTFSNNFVSDKICIWFHSDSITSTMSFCNIIHNNSPSGHGVVFFQGGGFKKLMYCILRNNQNCLFYVQSGSFELSHSFIDHSSSSFSISTAVSTENNNSFFYRITYQIQFFDSHHCNADIPFPLRTLDMTVLVQKQMNTINQNHMRSFYLFFTITLLMIV